MKPPYRIPSMSEVDAQPWNGLSAISTFSGGGGSSTGYKMAGYRVLWANEFVEAARETYAANHPSTMLDGRDIREVQAVDILKATGLAKGQLDLFDGSPPCSAFSTAGRRAEGWGESTKSYSDRSQSNIEDLFFEFSRLLEGLQPRVFVAENVSGLVKGVAKGKFKQIHSALVACGYRVKASLLNASWLGVPQARQRLIFVGVRNDLRRDPVFPKPLPYQHTLAEALAGLEHERGEGFRENAIYQHWLRCDPITGHSETRHNLVRMKWNRPANTICARWATGIAAVTLPDEPFYPSIGQLKRICSFPDDYKLSGSYQKQWERLGRSVPPLMMRAVAGALRDEVLSR